MTFKFILLLLQVVLIIIRNANDREQQQIGEDRAIRNALIELTKRTKVAQQISEESKHWSDADVVDKLRNDFRD